MMTTQQQGPISSESGLIGERRPEPALMKYYALESLLSGPGILILLPLRYVFDQEGVTVRWGILFHREVSLTYARTQDIHLVSNVFEPAIVTRQGAELVLRPEMGDDERSALRRSAEVLAKAMADL